MEKNPRKIFHLRYLHRSHIKSAQMNLFALYGVRDIKFHHFTGCFAVPLIFSSRKSFAEEFDSTSRQIFTLPYYLSDVKEIHNNPKKKTASDEQQKWKIHHHFSACKYIFFFLLHIMCCVWQQMDDRNSHKNSKLHKDQHCQIEWREIGGNRLIQCYYSSNT